METKLNRISVIVKQSGSMGALDSHRALKRKLQKEGHFKIIKQNGFFEKPSDRKRRKRKEAIKELKNSLRMKYRR